MTLDLDFYKNFFAPKASCRYFDGLAEEIIWRQKKIKIFGREVLEPRLTAWHGDPGAVYTYSGTRQIPAPWTPVLLNIKFKVEKKCGAKFNSVLLNFYRDHRDSMGFHSDDEKELGTEPVIASVSFGATRRFVMKPRQGNASSAQTVELTNGSLLVMRGKFQQNWKHGVPKEPRHCETRINLTFRKIAI